MSAPERTRATNEWLPDFGQAAEIVKYASPQGFEKSGDGRPTREGYYGIPMLKRPTWRWQIALYFFLEGVSAGSFLIAALAELSGRDRDRELKRAGYYTAFLTFLPAPPLLIDDLGRPERFHHMLRVFKPSSPMNLGAWALGGYSLPLTLLMGRQLMDRGGPLSFRPLEKISKLIPARVASAAGIPFALTMVSYPGVLLSTTSTPVWAKSRFLGALFACSSIGTGAAALSLALALRGSGNEKTIARLEKIEAIARICEGAALAAYLATTGDAARPLTRGRYAWHLWLGAVGAGLAAPAILSAVSSGKRKQSRARSIVNSALSLAGGLALKWAVTYAGRESAVDLEASHRATRPAPNAPGWGPAERAAAG